MKKREADREEQNDVRSEMMNSKSYDAVDVRLKRLLADRRYSSRKTDIFILYSETALIHDSNCHKHESTSK